MDPDQEASKAPSVTPEMTHTQDPEIVLPTVQSSESTESPASQMIKPEMVPADPKLGKAS